jgi:hypothetical protein
VSAGHFIACHHAEILSLKGALEHQIPLDPNPDKPELIRLRRNE